MPAERTPIHYTRCPVPTATGIALERGLFDALYAATPYAMRDIAASGDPDAHYTHAIARCFREGGGAPPVWARARGADTRLLAMTFMDETLGIFVRRDDPARTVGDLAGRRIGLPVRPRLPFNFWRFAAEKGFHSALRCHGLPDAAVTVVDVVEGGATPARAGERASGGFAYRGQLDALLEGRIDALFGKGLEIARLEHAAAGRIRMLFDVATSPEPADRVNNSTPRLVTASARLVDEDSDAAVRYLQALLRASAWASAHPDETRGVIARDCGVEAAAVDRCLERGYAAKLAPQVDDALLGTVGVLKSFMLARGYIDRDFELERWVDRGPLSEALRREAG